MNRPIGRTSGIIAALAFLALTACATPQGPKDLTSFAPVPEAARRLTYDLTADPQAVMEEALQQSVCLVLSGKVAECEDAPQTPDICNQRTTEEITTALRPAFEVLPSIKLTSPSRVKQQVTELIPGAFATDEVYDARRRTLCLMWPSPDGGCLAIRTDNIWILLHAPPVGDRTIDRVEVFLAGPTCTNELT